MKKLAAALVATALVAFGFAGPAPSASAVDLPIPTASPYPPTVCDITVSKTRVAPGETFTVTVTSDQPTTITATYGSQSASKENTKELVATFTAPTGGSTRTTQVRGVCGPKDGGLVDVVVVVDDGSDGDADADGGSDGDADADGGSQGDADGAVNADAGATDAAADADADAGDANGILPGTGGTDFWLLLLGLLLLLAGTGAVLRRRHNG